MQRLTAGKACGAMLRLHRPVPFMSAVAFALAAQNGWLFLALAGLALASAAMIWQWMRLRRTHERLRTALNNMSQGLCMWSPSGHLILCNERYVQMYNLQPEL